MNQKTPVIYQDENKVIFCGMREKMTKMLLLGPICIEDMSYVEIHRYCKAYQIENEQCPPKLKLQNLLALLELFILYKKLRRKYEDEKALERDCGICGGIWSDFADFIGDSDRFGDFLADRSCICSVSDICRWGKAILFFRRR